MLRHNTGNHRRILQKGSDGRINEDIAMLSLRYCPITDADATERPASPSTTPVILFTHTGWRGTFRVMLTLIATGPDVLQ